MYKNFILTESEKETILNMHKDSGYGKPLNGSMEQPVDELDHAGFHDRDDLQILRDSIDRNKMVSVAFVKKDGSVRHMLIRKSLKSSVFSDAPKTDAQMNIQSNHDLKRVVDINSYKRELKKLRNDNPEMDPDEMKTMAAKLVGGQSVLKTFLVSWWAVGLSTFAMKTILWVVLVRKLITH